MVLGWSNNGSGAVRRHIRVSKRMGELVFFLFVPGGGKGGLLIRALRVVGLAANVLSLGLHSLACFQSGQAEEGDGFEKADGQLKLFEG